MGNLEQKVERALAATTSPYSSVSFTHLNSDLQPLSGPEWATSVPQDRPRIVRPYEGYQFVIGKDLQPFSKYYADKLKAELDIQLKRGNVDFNGYFRTTGLFPALKFLEYMLDQVDAKRDMAFPEYLDNFLANVQEKIPLLKYPVSAARTINSNLFHPYKRPGNLAAKYANREELGMYAYALLGRNRVGMVWSLDTMGVTDQTQRAIWMLAKELSTPDMDLTKETGMIDLYQVIAEHEIIGHLARLYNDPQGTPYPGPEEITLREHQIRDYEESANNTHDPTKKERYLRLAEIARRLTYGHNGVGPSSNTIARRKLLNQSVDRAMGEYRPDRIGDELYSSLDGMVDDHRLKNDPGTGSAGYAAQKAYSNGIGEPLHQRPEEVQHAQHAPTQHKANTVKYGGYKVGERRIARASNQRHGAAQHAPTEHNASQGFV